MATYLIMVKEGDKASKFLHNDGQVKPPEGDWMVATWSTEDEREATAKVAYVYRDLVNAEQASPETIVSVMRFSAPQICVYSVDWNLFHMLKNHLD
jgi:hypothetical protein